MKILHVVQRYDPAVGGTEFLMQALSERLVSRHGDEVTVFTSTAWNTEDFRNRHAPQMAAGDEVRNGVRVRRFPVFAAAGWPLTVAQFLAWRLRLPRNDVVRTLFNGPLIFGLTGAIRRSGAQVVAASAFPLQHMQCAARARRPGLPVVLIGGLHPLDAFGFERRDIFEAIRAADRFVAYTTYERDWVVSRGIDPAKVEVIGVGVDPARFAGHDGAAFRVRHGLGAEPLVAFVGQQSRHKGVEHLVAAMRCVWRRVPEARLVIAGAATGYTPFIAAAVAALPPRQRRRVHTLGPVTHDEKCELLRACAVFASPSRFESFGITFLEAWLSGAPVVSTRSGAIPSVVGDGEDGLLCEYGDTGELAGLIVELLEDPAARARMAAAGRAKVERSHTLDLMVDRLRGLYAVVAGGGSGR